MSDTTLVDLDLDQDASGTVEIEITVPERAELAGLLDPAAVSARKRVFDVVFCVLAAPVWVPLLLLGLLGVLASSGLPLLYISPRRVYGTQVARVAKLRTMVRDAAQIANRQTVPIRDQRFLNIEIDSPLYTPVGRLIERYNLTELPQVVHVLSGKMSVIGNRPLPEDVVAALVEAYPDVEDRFLTRCGLTGPAQLVGRFVLSDLDRLAIESAYCRNCLRRYSVRLDFMMALTTLLILCRVRRPMTPQEVLESIDSWSRPLWRATRHALTRRLGSIFGHL